MEYTNVRRSLETSIPLIEKSGLSLRGLGDACRKTEQIIEESWQLLKDAEKVSAAYNILWATPQPPKESPQVSP